MSYQPRTTYDLPTSREIRALDVQGLLDAIMDLDGAAADFREDAELPEHAAIADELIGWAENIERRIELAEQRLQTL